MDVLSVCKKTNYIKMEALERRGKVLALAATVFIVFSSQCKGVEGKNSTRMSYVCPPMFIRLGHSCYFFSENKATWQNALFTCKYDLGSFKKRAYQFLKGRQLTPKPPELRVFMGGGVTWHQDRGGNLSVPARWEDRNLRNYLNRPGIDKASRWIGGIYDYVSKAWKWGGELKEMHYQSFSKMKKMTPEELQFHCIAMTPELLYRWAARSCYEPRQFICQTKLKKVPKSKLKELRRRYQRMGKINEITAPSVSREVDDPRMNDVTSNPVKNPKSYDLKPSPLRKLPRRRNQLRNNVKTYDLRPNEARKRSRPNAQRRLTRPFPGYQWNRRDPEGSYKRNTEILLSGRTGLSPQLIKVHLTRLEHLRDRQLARQKRLRENDDWLVNKPPALVHTHARTYTVDNNISALHPKTIVEEFDMLPPPPPAVIPRPVRNIW